MFGCLLEAVQTVRVVVGLRFGHTGTFQAPFFAGERTETVVFQPVNDSHAVWQIVEMSASKPFIFGGIASLTAEFG